MSETSPAVHDRLAALEAENPAKLYFLLWRPDEIMPVAVSYTREEIEAEAALIEPSLTYGRNAALPRASVLSGLTFSLFPRLGRDDRPTLATATLTYLTVKDDAPILVAKARFFALVTDGVEFDAGADIERERFLENVGRLMMGRETKLMATEVMEAQAERLLSHDPAQRTM
jgi:hypothetical protein